MTKKQENQLSMWTATDAVLKEHEDKWKTIVAFADAANAFQKIRQEVTPVASTQLKDNTGIAYGKGMLRTRLIEQCLQVALNIKSYAINTKDFGLEKQFEFTASYFEKLRDNTVPVVAGTIYEKAVELKQALGDYGTGDEEIGQLETSLTAYKGMNPAPRLAKGIVKQATLNISDKINEGMLQLSLMDNLVGNFNKKYPDFVSAFHNARMVIALGSRTRKDVTKPPEITAEGK